LSKISSTTFIFSSIFPSEASIKCKIKSDSTLSSKVEANASIRFGGKSLINQIVSLIKISLCDKNSHVCEYVFSIYIFHTDVPRVAKSLFSDNTHL
jgi:hypothetical protein